MYESGIINEWAESNLHTINLKHLVKQASNSDAGSVGLLYVAMPSSF